MPHTVYKRRTSKRLYMRQILMNRVRQGEMFLIKEMMEDDSEYFRNYFRMEKEVFQKLVGLLIPSLAHAKTHLLPINPEQRLAITLRYLCSGDDQRSLAFCHRISPASATTIIKETLDAIWETLHVTFMPVPTEDDWTTISTEFWEKWQFPNCLGAMDGKHVRIKCPNNTGTLHYNYKGYFSNVLLAVVDADYKFTVVDIGAPGSQSDGGILGNSNFGQALYSNSLPLPPDHSLPGTTIPSPSVFLGDSGFPLKRNLMRPYPVTTTDLKEKIFNYRLSGARRISENAFGIMSARFRIFQRTIEASKETANSVIKASVILHNYLMVEEKNPLFTPDDDSESFGGNWREVTRNDEPSDRLEEIEEVHSVSRDEVIVRDTFASYLASDVGSLPWQVVRASRTATVFPIQ